MLRGGGSEEGRLRYVAANCSRGGGEVGGTTFRKNGRASGWKTEGQPSEYARSKLVRGAMSICH